MAGEANIWNPRTLLELSGDTKTIEERLTATAGQTLFTLTEFAYVLGTGALEVHKNGLLLAKGTDWTEQTGSTFSIVIASTAGDQIIATGSVGITGNVDVRDTDIFVTNYQAIRDYAGIEITLYSQGKATVGDTGESFFQKITGAAPGFYVDNDDTIIVPTGGDGSIGWVREDLEAKLKARDYVGSKTLAEATADLTILAGETVRISDRGNADFLYTTGETPNTFDIIAHDTLALQLKLVETNSVSMAMLGGFGSNSTAICQHVVAGTYTTLYFDWLMVPYTFTSSVAIAVGTSLLNVIGRGRPTLQLTVGSASQIFAPAASKQFMLFENFLLDSDGTSADPYFTYGIVFTQSSFCNLKNIRFTNFSGAGIEFRQCVNMTMDDMTGNLCNYGLSFQPVGPNGNTTIIINRPYISGCLRGININEGVTYAINQPVLENCGDSVSSDGAMHLNLANKVSIDGEYYESNGRNKVTVDSNITYTGGQTILAATSPDITSYSAVGTPDRGHSILDNNKLIVTDIQHDPNSTKDLTIGSNMIVPAAGTSVEWGEHTTERLLGTAVNATWSAIKVLDGQTTALVEDRIVYRYSVAAGSADLPTGHDAGYIFGGVIYSDTGSIPAWLRVNVSTLEVNITSTTYGLNWALILTQTEGGGV